ncbi:MFS transporter [Streptomyces mirabilis]|uniref:MFS transporter n=1 Tax=Streptomyces mirabilis TaxID=68239 RepID=UPI003323104B
MFIGSALAATAPAFGLLLVGRALQGVGMGLMPLTIAVAREHLPAERMRSGISSLSITTSVGAGLGYPVTGLIAQHLDYRAGFWFAALLSAHHEVRQHGVRHHAGDALPRGPAVHAPSSSERPATGSPTNLALRAAPRLPCKESACEPLCASAPTRYPGGLPSHRYIPESCRTPSTPLGS